MVINIRPETKSAIINKSLYHLNYKDRKTGESSSKHTVELLREIGIKPNHDNLITYLFSGFGAISYDVSALIEARGRTRKELLKLWKEYYKDNRDIIEDWIKAVIEEAKKQLKKLP